nr:MAG TPA: hypothetical protein [Caudoviricetes sp.]
MGKMCLYVCLLKILIEGRRDFYFVGLLCIFVSLSNKTFVLHE